MGLVLLAMVIIEIGSMRRDEAKLYLDTLLVQPISRGRWLKERLMMAGSVVLITTVVASLAIWVVAQAQQIDLSLEGVWHSMMAVVAGLVLVGGVGVGLYGVWPRLSVAGMTIVVGWAFMVDILKNLLELDSWI